MRTIAWHLNFAAIIAAAFALQALAAEVYPTPQQMKASGREFAPPAAIAVKAGPKTDGPALRALAAEFREDPNAPFVVTFASNGMEAGPGISLRAGAYRLKLTSAGATINGIDGAGEFYAVQTLVQLLGSPKAREAAIAENPGIPNGVPPMARETEVADWPDIPFRGTVEGFYGRPWGTEGRLSQFSFYGKCKMNAYIYGPKDDPYHHGKWREPYPEKEAADFRRLLAAARENHVNFYWAIHLGGAFADASQREANYAALFRKLDAMHALGFRAFAAFFDDFGGADAALHAEICNRILRDFLAKKGDCAPLVMCPNVYSGNGGNAYCRTLGEKLDSSVMAMWTGQSICSDIKKGPRDSLAAAIRRPPFVWWNWPVNDYCRRKVLMGRTYGNDIADYAGFVSNPMENCEASKIALFGVADWTWNMRAFDSERSWRAGIRRLYPGFADSMQVFADHNSDQGPNGHGYSREESAAFKPLADRARQEYQQGGKLSPETDAALGKAFAAMAYASKTLASALPEKRPALWREIEFWNASFYLQAGLGDTAVKLARTADSALKAQLFCLVAGVREGLAEASAKHQARFRAATFENDRQYCHGCQTGTRVVQPLIDLLIDGEWRKFQRAETGGAKPPERAGLYRAFADIPQIRQPGAHRDGKYVHFNRAMELMEAAPGQSFGIALPDGLAPDYIHARLGTPEAATQGKIELSKDGGKTWVACNTHNHDEQMETRLNPADRWNAARWRNASDKPVRLKIDMFKFDISGDGVVNDLSAATDGDLATAYAVEPGKSVTIPLGAVSARPLVIATGDYSFVAVKGGVRITARKGGVRICEVLPGSGK